MSGSPRTGKNSLKNQEPKRPSVTPTDQPSSRKYQKKGTNPVRVSHVELPSDKGHPSSFICNNSACRALKSVDDAFCKRCSCCICKQFDDNKDPSLWLVCQSEYENEDSCGLSAHLECAFQTGKVGVVDGSYCCASCGKVTLILGCWKKQLNIAKDTRRVDILCERISLSYRLLEGTLKFQELHGIVEDAMRKLEIELGPLNGVSAKMSRGGIVARLPIAGEVQKLCALAIEKVDERLAELSIRNLHLRACRFRFEEITSTSVIIVLMEPPTVACSDVKGFKLWYCKRGNETYPKEPFRIFPGSQSRMLISNLEADTEYSFRMASYSEAGDVSLFQAICSTKSGLMSNEPPISDSKSPKTCSSCEFDLNIASVPDLNEDITPPFGTPVGEDCRKPACHDINTDYGAAPLDNEKKRLRSDGTDVSTSGEVPAVNSQELPRKIAVTTNETTNKDRIMLDGSPHGKSEELGSLDDKFDNCVKLIRRLECDGHMNEEFRKKFLTWFGFRSTEKEKRVVYAFIEAFIDDPSSLVAQLVDAFSERVSFKKPHNDA